MTTPRILITPEPLDAESVTALVKSTANGGVVTFEGITRDETGGRTVVRLEYEAYPEMAEKTFQQIFDEVQERWSVTDVAVAHRIGRLELGEASLIVAVAAPHRAEAFTIAMYVVDRIKEIVPIWKKEFFEDGSVWVGSAGATP
jgi:molybdopterin synthase catalytic subunit